MADERRKTRVACTIPNGIMLNLFKEGYDDGTGDGVKPTIRDGLGVRLNGPSARHTGAVSPQRLDLDPVETEVDAEWFARWLDQNKLNPMVTGGHIREIEDDPEEGRRPTTAP